MPPEKQKSSESGTITKSEARVCRQSFRTLEKMIVDDWSKEAEHLAKSPGDPAPGGSDK